MRFQRPGRINWPHFVKTIESTGLSRSCISKLTGLTKSQLERLAQGSVRDPKHTAGCALVELYNWRLKSILSTMQQEHTDD